jgi:hypothetical protein
MGVFLRTKTDNKKGEMKTQNLAKAVLLFLESFADPFLDNGSPTVKELETMAREALKEESDNAPINQQILSEYGYVPQYRIKTYGQTVFTKHGHLNVVECTNETGTIYTIGHIMKEIKTVGDLKTLINEHGQ